jgi:hypothetical protein
VWTRRNLYHVLTSRKIGGHGCGASGPEYWVQEIEYFQADPTPSPVWRVGESLGKVACENARCSFDEQGGRKLMPLINVVVVLIVVGVILWLINRFIPMQGTIKSILNGVVVIAVVLWLLNVFGLFSSFSHIRVGS